MKVIAGGTERSHGEDDMGEAGGFTDAAMTWGGGRHGPQGPGEPRL